MKYLILAYESNEDLEARRGNEARQGQYWSAWKAYIDSMSHAGIIDSMHALLEDYTATTVRLREGKRQLHDGPYADTDEQIGRYFVIEVANLDRALEWASFVRLRLPELSRFDPSCRNACAASSKSLWALDTDHQDGSRMIFNERNHT